MIRGRRLPAPLKAEPATGRLHFTNRQLATHPAIDYRPWTIDLLLLLYLNTPGKIPIADTDHIEA
jgi:hypothetical protein